MNHKGLVDLRNAGFHRGRDLREVVAHRSPATWYRDLGRYPDSLTPHQPKRIVWHSSTTP